METEPAPSQESTPPANPSPEEPVAAVPTSETTPAFAQAPGGPDSTAVPSTPMQKGDPDWSEPEPSTNGGAAKKPGGAPAWAATVPSSPGEAPRTVQPTPPPSAEPQAAEDAGGEWSDTVAGEPAPEPGEPAPEPGEPAPDPEADEAVITAAPLSEPPKAVAADALKSTWPPRGESAPAGPEETDIWPPEPPTEHSMPAWPPPSEFAQRGVAAYGEEEPSTPAQAIPSWPDGFESEPAASAPPAAAEGATAQPVAPTVPPPGASPAATVRPEPAAAAEPPAPAVERPETTPPSEPETIPPAEPAAAGTAAGQSGPPSHPAWAPSPGSGETPASQEPVRPAASAFQVPAWAPRVPLAAEPGTPTWFSPKEQIPHTTSQPVPKSLAPEPPPAPVPPASGGQLPVAHVPAAPPPAPAAPAAPRAPEAPAPTPPKAPAAAAPPAPPAPAAPSAPPAPGAKPTWQVVEQARPAKAPQGPTAEDRSYAEWFSWAKRGGAPASACHAAAQGAFKALSSGKDLSTAVQWATAAMSRPPENVTYARQTYCAWFALANIDLNLDQHRSHSFAGAAVQALDNGADASQAHAAGLAAAGIK